MYKVAQTSHGVLLLTDPSFYQSPSAKRFLKNIDLESSRPLVDSFKKLWSQSPIETNNRKYGVKKFCNHYLKNSLESQIIVLGGGIDPFSIELADNYPSSRVFDVDLDNTELKEKLNKEIQGPVNIDFCKANIADSKELSFKLKEKGWDKKQKTLIVCEGISYYISPQQLKEAILALKPLSEGGVVLEYSLSDEAIYPEKYRESVRKAYLSLQEKISWPTPLVRYSHDDIHELSKNIGSHSTTIIDQAEIEREKTGENKLYPPPCTGVFCIAYFLFLP